MPDRPLKLRDLERILRHFDVFADRSRGKGSHILFFRRFAEGVFTYPVPNRAEVKLCYVRDCRRRFRLTPEDGITDEEFYSH
jgi:hypothetical protein